MSRIHEALKKAEEQRTASQGVQAEAMPMAEASTETAVATAVNTAVEHLPAMSQTPSFSSSFTFDTLLARCAQAPWSPDSKTMLFFNSDERAYGTEEFRTLRSRLYHAREKISLKKVLITSALPKEGKSFMAANLAQVLVRQHGRRVLLIDADLRGPRLHEMLGTSSGPGLSEYLNGESDEFSIMQRGSLENLFFVPSGLAGILRYTPSFLCNSTVLPSGAA